MGAVPRAVCTPNPVPVSQITPFQRLLLCHPQPQARQEQPRPGVQSHDASNFFLQTLPEGGKERAQGTALTAWGEILHLLGLSHPREPAGSPSPQSWFIL